MAIPLFTYQDAVEHGLDFLGGTPDALALRDARRAVLSAYRELINVRIWQYLINHDRILTQPPFHTGYVAYNNTTRQRLDDQTLLLTEQVNFGQDLDYAPQEIAGLVLNTPILVLSPNHGLKSGDPVIIEGVLVAVTERTHEDICNKFFVDKDPTFLTFEAFARQYSDLKRRLLLTPRGGFKS